MKTLNIDLHLLNSHVTANANDVCVYVFASKQNGMQNIIVINCGVFYIFRKLVNKP